MKEKKSKENKPPNSFTSAKILSEKEFNTGIRNAEKGPFYSVQESMCQFESWLKKTAPSTTILYGIDSSIMQGKNPERVEPK